MFTLKIKFITFGGSHKKLFSFWLLCSKRCKEKVGQLKIVFRAKGYFYFIFELWDTSMFYL